FGGQQLAGPHQDPKRAADALRMEAGRPRRDRPEPWIIGSVEPSREVERRPIEGGDRLCLADRCRIKGHEYLPPNAILSPPDAFSSLETTQPDGGRISGRFPTVVSLVRSRSAVLPRDLQDRPRHPA